MRKILVFLFILLISWNCRNKKRDVYNEADYQAYKIQQSHDTPDFKVFVYKYDLRRTMVIYYYFDGSRLAKFYLYNNKNDGLSTMYLSNGKISHIDSFHNEVKYYEKSFQTH